MTVFPSIPHFQFIMKRSKPGTHPSYAQASKRNRPSQKAKTPTKSALIRALGIERKYFDVAVGFNAPSTVDWASTEIGADMPQIPQGDDQGQREGRKVTLTRIHFRGSLTQTATTAATAVLSPPITRIALVRNYQPNGVSMNGEDVMGLNGGTAANTQVAIHMFQSTISFQRAKIVDDVMCYQNVTAAANNTTATTVSGVVRELPVNLTYRPKTPITIQWASGATAIPTHNSFNILINAEATTYTPSLQGIVRFYYTDN